MLLSNTIACDFCGEEWHPNTVPCRRLQDRKMLKCRPFDFYDHILTFAVAVSDDSALRPRAEPDKNSLEGRK